MPKLVGLSLIGGSPVPGETGKEFAAVNSATGEALSPAYRAATSRQVEAAVLAAQEAFVIIAMCPANSGRRSCANRCQH